VSTTPSADVPILVLILHPSSERIDTIVRTLSKGVYSKIMTCNNPLGCLDLARRHKPKIVFIHSSEAVVEGTSLRELIEALSPESEVRIID
jgi:hypothetical protein